jgi:hypothetical protein
MLRRLRPPAAGGVPRDRDQKPMRRRDDSCLGFQVSVKVLGSPSRRHDDSDGRDLRLKSEAVRVVATRPTTMCRPNADVTLCFVATTTASQRRRHRIGDGVMTMAVS